MKVDALVRLEAVEQALYRVSKWYTVPPMLPEDGPRATQLNEWADELAAIRAELTRTELGGAQDEKAGAEVAPLRGSIPHSPAAPICECGRSRSRHSGPEMTRPNCPGYTPTNEVE